MPATSEPPGHYSLTWGRTITRFDFKNGVGIADPADENNPCTALLLGFWTDFNPALTYWVPDLRMGTNLNGPGIGISRLSPPLTPINSGWLAGSAGIPLAPCPIPGSPGNIWLIWSGFNWHSVEDSMDSEINLCTQQSQTNGCFPIIGSQILYASACPWANAEFTANYGDAKGKEISGLPWDQLHMKSDTIGCSGITHSHNYTPTVTDFDVNFVSQGFDLIKNEAVVHYGPGTSYAIICWSIDYIDLDDLAAGTQTAQTHDWKLILDLGDDPANIADAVLNHLGPLDTNGLPAPIGAGVGTFAFQGLYSLSETAAGQNGFGPCIDGPAPETKKPKDENQRTEQKVLCQAWRHANAGSPGYVKAHCDGMNVCHVNYGAATKGPPTGDTEIQIPANTGLVTVTCEGGNCQGHPIHIKADLWSGAAGSNAKTTALCKASGASASVEDTQNDPATPDGEKATFGKSRGGAYQCIFEFNRAGGDANAYHATDECRKPT